MRESRRALERLVETAAKQERNLLLQSNPFFPELLRQPDVVIVPRLARLAAIYVYTPTQPINWRNVLMAIEDLFELKIAVQQSAVAVGVYDFREGVREASVNATELLEQMFDLLLPVREEYESERLRNETQRAIRNVEPKERFFPLWKAEKQRISENLTGFSEERYREFIEEHRRPKRPQTKVISETASAADDLGLRPEREALVRTPKEAIGGLPERSRFAFDFGFRDRRGRQVMIDAVSLGRYGSRPTLRYLMTKARFTSYEPVAYEPGYPLRLIPRQEPLRRILLVDGNIAGPRHDPYRYVRALLSVGWEIERPEPEVLARIADGDI